MAASHTIRVFDPDDWRRWRDLRLAALTDSPDQFLAKLSDWQGAGDTEQRWRSRLSDVPFNAVVDLDGDAAGMVSATTPDEGATHLIGMWVAPHARGRGAGDALISAVIAWSQSQGVAMITLDVTASNERAIRLYARHGFIDAGAIDCTGSGGALDRRMIRDDRREAHE